MAQVNAVTNKRGVSRRTGSWAKPFKATQKTVYIGLYRDVWIAAIASSRKSMATRTAAIDLCVRFHGRRVRHVYVTMQITFLARKSALIYRWGLRQRVASLTIDCNGVSAMNDYNYDMSTTMSTMSMTTMVILMIMTKVLFFALAPLMQISNIM